MPRQSQRRKFNRAKLLFALKLRSAPTPAEQQLWRAIRRIGPQVRRQAILRGYIVDFYIPRWCLVVEVDGGYHNTPTQRAYDQTRDRHIQAYGYTVIRFTNEQVINSLASVVKAIAAYHSRD